MSAIKWLRQDAEDLYDPEYGDIIRIASLAGFGRGKASTLVSELSGRDPDTRKVDSSRIPVAYELLESTLLRIVNKYDFQNFTMTIKSAGFIDPGMIGSMNALNFAYALYLRLRQDAAISDGERKRIVRRWFVMSMLTARHSGSFESTWDQDIRRINIHGATSYLKLIEETELSDAFWEVSLPSSLDTSSPRSPYFQAFLAAQVMRGERGFLSKAITIRAMQEQQGDIHHLVPKDYLRKNGFPDRSDYNQVANYALTETPINIRISNRAPNEYMAEVYSQFGTGAVTLGEINDSNELRHNLEGNAIPETFHEVNAGNFREFLAARRKMIGMYIKRYYETL
jgi:hypothetical protein